MFGRMGARFAGIGALGASGGTTNPTLNDREFILAGDLFPVFICETGTRSEILPGPVYLTETS